MEVRRVEQCQNGEAGRLFCCGGYMEIAARTEEEVVQTYSSKVNTFYHELIHNILYNMGDKLHNNEQFVSTFAGFLTEAMTTADYPAKRH